MEYIFVSGYDKAYESVIDKCRRHVVASFTKIDLIFIVNDAIGKCTDVVIACDGMNVVGFAGVHTKLDGVYLHHIAVRPDFRKQGIGRKLIGEVVKFADDRDVTCRIKFDNKASQALFSECGFHEVTSKREDEMNFYRHPGKVLNRIGTKRSK